MGVFDNPWLRFQNPQSQNPQGVFGQVGAFGVPPFAPGMAGQPSFAPNAQIPAFQPADPNAISQPPPLFQPPQQQPQRQPQNGEVARMQQSEPQENAGFFEGLQGLLGGDGNDKKNAGQWGAGDLASLGMALIGAGEPTWDVSQPSGWTRAGQAIADVSDRVEDRGWRNEQRDAMRDDRAWQSESRGRERTDWSREDAERGALDAWIAQQSPEDQAWMLANPQAAYQQFVQRQGNVGTQQVDGGFVWQIGPDGRTLERIDEVPLNAAQRAEVELDRARIAASGRGGRTLTFAQARQARNDYERAVADAREGTARANLALGFARTALANRGRIPGDDETVRNNDAALLFVTARLIQGTGVLSDPDIQILSGSGLDSVLADVQGFVGGGGKLSNRQRFALSGILDRYAGQLNSDEWRVYDDHSAFAEEQGYDPAELGIIAPRSQRPGEQTEEQNTAPTQEEIEAEIARRQAARGRAQQTQARGARGQRLPEGQRRYVGTARTGGHWEVVRNGQWVRE